MDNLLQSKINAVNIEYRKNKSAIIIFQETPIIQTRKGLVRKLSTVDYIGNFKNKFGNGQGIAFDAKMCDSTTSIPLGNFKEHQLLFLKYWEETGGKAFFLVHFYKLYKDKAFMTPISLVDNYFFQQKRKSIPIHEFNLDWLVPIDDYLQLIK
jgi:recombination protein U